jgi:hypothetical protein
MQGNIGFSFVLVAMSCVSAKHCYGIRATHLSIHNYRLKLARIYICNACGGSDQPAVSSTDSGGVAWIASVFSSQALYWPNQTKLALTG